MDVMSAGTLFFESGFIGGKYSELWSEIETG